MWEMLRVSDKTINNDLLFQSTQAIRLNGIIGLTRVNNNTQQRIAEHANNKTKEYNELITALNREWQSTQTIRL